MKDIIIVCAGSFGKEIYTIVKAINRKARAEGREEEYRILGFLDDNPKALEGSGYPEKIIGSISDWHPVGDEVYALGAAFAGVKIKLAELLKSRGCRFETLVAPWSLVSEDCVMGEGCFITAYSISAGVVIGDFVSVMGSMLCPGARIDDYSTTTGFTVVENATIGKGVFVGSHAVIASGVHVNDFAQVSAGSIVQNDVKEGSTVFGVPAVEID